jgi:hypothetical protein
VWVGLQEIKTINYCVWVFFLIEIIFLVNNIFITELKYNISILEYSVDRVTGNKKNPGKILIILWGSLKHIS